MTHLFIVFSCLEKSFEITLRILKTLMTPDRYGGQRAKNVSVYP
jgi:hypothetical protein